MDGKYDRVVAMNIHQHGTQNTLTLHAALLLMNVIVRTGGRHGGRKSQLEVRLARASARCKAASQPQVSRRCRSKSNPVAKQTTLVNKAPGSKRRRTAAASFVATTARAGIRQGGGGAPKKVESFQLGQPGPCPQTRKAPRQSASLRPGEETPEPASQPANPSRRPVELLPCQQPALAKLRNWFVLTGDRSKLDKLLQTARASQLPRGRDFAPHMRAHAAWLAALPFLATACSRVGPHVRRQHALGFEARALRQGKVINWGDLKMLALKQLEPDRGNYLNTAPYWINPRGLAKQLGCGLLWVSMWSGLMGEVLRAWPGCLELVMAHLPQVEVCLLSYLAVFNVSPRPLYLIREFLRTLPAEQRPTGRIIDGAGKEDESDYEKETETDEKDVD